MNRGGKREGAGRKRKPENRTYAVRLNLAQVTFLRLTDKSISTAIGMLINSKNQLTDEPSVEKELK